MKKLSNFGSYFPLVTTVLTAISGSLATFGPRIEALLAATIAGAVSVLIISTINLIENRWPRDK